MYSNVTPITPDSHFLCKDRPENFKGEGKRKEPESCQVREEERAGKVRGEEKGKGDKAGKVKGEMKRKEQERSQANEAERAGKGPGKQRRREQDSSRVGTEGGSRKGPRLGKQERAGKVPVEQRRRG